MPNWCSNNLTVYSDEAVKYLLNKDGELDFEILCPMPEELRGTRSPVLEHDEELIAKYGSDNWYDWRCAHWGVKWNASGSYVTRKPRNRICIEFNTPWGPPVEWLMELSNKGFDFDLDWEEEGGYSGSLYSCDGIFGGDEG